MLVAVDWTARRLLVCGHRWHHGMVGGVMMIVGAALFWTDRHDWPFVGVK